MSKTLKSIMHWLCLLAGILATSLMPVSSLNAASGEPAALEGVRALVYSTTAAELQWNRQGTEQVQVSYNGQVLGRFDANSLFRGNLDPTVAHRFELRTIDAAHSISAPLVLSFTSGDFKPPIKEVRVDGQAATTVASTSGAQDSAGTNSGTATGTNPGTTTGATATGGSPAAAGSPALLNVHARVYSSTAAELFWSRSNAQRVRISHNGQSLGSLDSGSLFKAGLDPSAHQLFELVALDAHGEAGEHYRLAFSTGSFDGQVQTIEAQAVSAGTSSTTQSTVVTQQPQEDAPLLASPTVQAPGSLSSQAVQSGDCVVRSIAQLSSCVDAAAGFRRINIQADLACSGSSCCPAGGAMLAFVNVSNLTIEGNGFRLLRRAGQRQCSLLDVSGASMLRINNWRLDDDAGIQPCVVGDRCPRMLHIRNSSGITLDAVDIRHAKGYAVYVQNVNGFSFLNGRLAWSGVLGMYIGHGSNSSTNIHVRNSTFTDNQTNAIALLGVTGSNKASNDISNNVFRRNHYRGQWPVAAQYGTGYTGGGQVYIARASGLTIQDNIIADGYCENCYVQQRMGTGVSGLELAMPGQSTVSNLLVRNNTISNHDAWGIFANQGSTLNGSVSITGNRLVNNSVGLKPGGYQASGNVIQDR